MNALNIAEYTHTLGLQAKTASAQMARAPAAIKNKALLALARLLQSAHTVDGIVKGLKAPDWPQDGWQALSRLALQMCKLAR